MMPYTNLKKIIKMYLKEPTQAVIYSSIDGDYIYVECKPYRPCLNCMKQNPVWYNDIASLTLQNYNNMICAARYGRLYRIYKAAFKKQHDCLAKSDKILNFLSHRLESIKTLRILHLGLFYFTNDRSELKDEDYEIILGNFDSSFLQDFVFNIG